MRRVIKTTILGLSCLLGSCFGNDFADGNLAPTAKAYRGRYLIISLAHPPVFQPFELELFPDKDMPSTEDALIAYSSTWNGPENYGESVRRWFFSPDRLPIIEWGGQSYFRFTGEGAFQDQGWKGTVIYVSDSDPDGTGLEELPTLAHAQRL